MSGLTLKLAAGVLAGIAVAVLVVMLDHALTTRGERFPFGDDGRGSPGLRALKDVLEAAPAVSRPALVTAAERSFKGLSLHSRAEAEALAGERLPLQRPHTPGERVFLPLDEGASWLVVTPPTHGPPPPPKPVIGLVLSLGALVVTAVGLTAWPLTRRIRKLQQGIRAIGEGRATEPLSERGRDVLADLARTVNGMAERVTRSLRDREELLQAVSHEIGTPLARMRFQLDLLEHSSPERRSEYASALQGELDELDQLASELVSWVEADAGHHASRAVEACTLIEAAVDAWGASPDSGGKRLCLVVAPDVVSSTINADPRQFERVFDNVLRNAWRHARSQVVVEVTRSEQWLRVSVSDDGEGIPEVDRDRVLEPFVRLENSDGSGRSGTGLGLAIARRIVQRHGGRIWIEASVQGGAAVHTTWPTIASPIAPADNALSDTRHA
jgi:signal transduction histidine kinase